MGDDSYKGSDSYANSYGDSYNSYNNSYGSSPSYPVVTNPVYVSKGPSFTRRMIESITEGFFETIGDIINAIKNVTSRKKESYQAPIRSSYQEVPYYPIQSHPIKTMPVSPIRTYQQPITQINPINPVTLQPIKTYQQPAPIQPIFVQPIKNVINPDPIIYSGNNIAFPSPIIKKKPYLKPTIKTIGKKGADPIYSDPYYINKKKGKQDLLDEILLVHSKDPSQDPSPKKRTRKEEYLDEILSRPPKRS